MAHHSGRFQCYSEVSGWTVRDKGFDRRFELGNVNRQPVVAECPDGYQANKVCDALNVCDSSSPQVNA